jgi:hypothetical protein
MLKKMLNVANKPMSALSLLLILSFIGPAILFYLKGKRILNLLISALVISTIVQLIGWFLFSEPDPLVAVAWIIGVVISLIIQIIILFVIKIFL